MDKKRVIYLATPYTHYHRYIELKRFNIVTRVSAILACNNIPNFSPITQSHQQSLTYRLPGTWKFWKSIDIPVLKVCTELWVLVLPGWRKSVGVSAERRIARRQRMPVKYITYDEDQDQVFFCNKRGEHIEYIH